MSVRLQPSADVSPEAEIGDGSSVWHLAQVREGAVLGGNCIVGRGAYVGTGVRMGDNCKLQNYALVYEPAVLEDGVFVGPAVVLTNDHYPRVGQPRRTLKRGDDWEAVGVTCREGASIGARAVCVAPVTIGRWATGRRRRRSSSRTSRTSPSSRACPRGGSAGSAEPGCRSSGRRRARWRCPQTGRLTSRHDETSDGGRRSMTDFIPPAKPLIGEEERAAVDRVLRSGMLAQGPEVAAFEEEFAEHFGLGRACVAVNSGTSGLHLGLLVVRRQGRATRSSSRPSPSPRPRTRWRSPARRRSSPTSTPTTSASTRPPSRPRSPTAPWASCRCTSTGTRPT